MSVVCLGSLEIISTSNKVQSMCTKYEFYDVARAVCGSQHSTDYSWLENMHKAVEGLFCRMEQYNHYSHALRYAESPADGMAQAAQELESLAEYEENLKPAKINTLQCYNFLRCLDYNSDMEDNMDPEVEYFAPEFMDQYKKDKQVLKNIIIAVATSYTNKAAEESSAKWCSL